MTGPRYTPLAAALPATVPFVGPETQERQRGRSFAARLGANESVFGPSPLAIDAMARAASESWQYGDPENYDLKEALSSLHNVPFDTVIVGEGIDGLLGYLVRLLVGPGDAVVTSDGAYPTFNFHVAGYGGTLHKVPFTGDHEDPEALVEKASEVGAKLIYLSNPNNPMGTWHSAEAVMRAIDAVPDGALLILDEAYVEFAPKGTALAFDTENPRVIRMRTFSKAYGMAGARVGYAIGHSDLIGAFNKVRNHFGMSRIAQAGALAALKDTRYLTSVISEVAQARARIDKIASAQGLETLASATNFVAMDCGQDGEFARRVLTELVARDVFVRMPFVAPQDRCIRIGVGTKADLDFLELQLPMALEAASEG